MNKLLAIPILFLLLIALTFKSSEPRERIGRDLKKLNLERSKFETVNKKRKSHFDAVIDIKRYFILPDKVFTSAEFTEFTADGLSIAKWQYNQPDERLTVQAFHPAEQPHSRDYNFYLLYVNDAVAATEAHYLSEDIFGLISYSINEETTRVKKEDRRDDFAQEKSAFEVKVRKLLNEGK